MNDIGIFSINLHSFYLNYGAALHSFAFQKYLESKGVSSVIVDYKSKHIGDFRLDFPALSFIKKRAKLKTIIHALFATPSYKRKFKAFNKFYTENCKMLENNGKSFCYEDFNSGKEMHFDFPVAICESDVIWSPKTSNGFDRVFFFDYPCFDEKTKIAYAPSISNTKLSKAEEKEFCRLLENFDLLSCRENQTAEYVSKLTGRKCPHVLDPVLLLDDDFYKPYMERQRIKNYLLCYNVMQNDYEMLSFGKKVAKEKGLKFVELSDFVRNKITHKVLSGRSIGEFLWLLKNADYIITNSFHGMCFAILFKKNFLIFERDGVDLKVKSVLEVLGLENFFVKKDLEFSEEILKNKIDYQEVEKNLQKQREISFNFIDEIIGVTKSQTNKEIWGGGYNDMV